MKNRIWNLIVFNGAGLITAILWISLFVAGLMVNSEYYRTAVSHGYAGFSDWIMVILTFTLSNVILLAFLAGLLGGISSTLSATENFTLSREEIQKRISDNKLDAQKVENPLISAFRGIFVFVAILSLQYLSSFNDMGAISKNSEQSEEKTMKKLEELYKSLNTNSIDSASLNSIKIAIQQESPEFMQSKNEELISHILLLKDSLATDTISANLKKMKHDLFMLRRNVKIPKDVDFSGMGFSSIGYFKFAVIVSFLSFIFGYNPKMFSSFIDGIMKKT